METVMKIVAQPLTTEAFAPFGDVLSTPSHPGRAHFSGGLGNGRAEARASLSMVHRLPIGGLPANVLERHEFSSQTFLPLEAGRLVVIVCPHAASSGPDLAGVRAFIARPDQGVTYGMNTWHHPLIVLDRPARLAVFMWRDGASGDEEFVPVTPFTVAAP
jgi:ureidoglycolate lyase